MPRMPHRVALFARPVEVQGCRGETGGTGFELDFALALDSHPLES